MEDNYIDGRSAYYVTNLAARRVDTVTLNRNRFITSEKALVSMGLKMMGPPTTPGTLSMTSNLIAADTAAPDLMAWGLFTFNLNIEAMNNSIVLKNVSVGIGHAASQMGVTTTQSYKNNYIHLEGATSVWPLYSLLYINMDARNITEFLNNYLVVTGGSSLTIYKDSSGTYGPYDSAQVGDLESNVGGTASGNTATTTVTAPNVSSSFVDLRYVLELLDGSPLIDAVTDSSSFTTDATDVLGNTRVVDGDGDGVAQVDIGAVEYQP